MRIALIAAMLLGSTASSASPPDPTTLWGNYQTNDGRMITIGRAIDNPAAPFFTDFKTGHYRTLVPQPSGIFCADECRTHVSFDAHNLTIVDGAGTIRARRLPIDIEDMAFSNGAVMFKGRLSKPAGAGPFPAVVIMGGTGKNLRDDYRAYPYFFVQHGFAVFTYDKRGAGASGGDSNTPQEGVALLAGDTTAAIAALRKRPDIDPDHVGVMGISHGAWPAVEVAALDPRVAFLVSVVGGGVAQWQAQLFDLQCQMRTDKFSKTDIETATRLMRKFYGLAAKGDFAAVPGLIAANKGNKWFDELPVAQIKDLSPEIVRTVSTKIWQEELSYDPAPRLRMVHVPIFVVVAENDVHVPPTENAEAIRRATAKNNAPATMVRLLDANHWQQKGKEYSGNFTYPPELFNRLGVWLDQLNRGWQEHR